MCISVCVGWYVSGCECGYVHSSYNSQSCAIYCGKNSKAGRRRER